MFGVLYLGVATGMRTMTPMAVLCWAAYLGYLPVEGTWAFWMMKLVSPLVFTVLALGEYVGDTLPRTPNRTDLLPLLARLGFGTLAGVMVASILNQPKAGGVILGAVGALIGSYGGYRMRRLGARLTGYDLPIALAESAVALGIAWWGAHGVYREIVRFADRALLHSL